MKIHKFKLHQPSYNSGYADAKLEILQKIKKKLKQIKADIENGRKIVGEEQYYSQLSVYNDIKELKKDFLESRK